jgi:hypothetical protein
MVRTYWLVPVFNEASGNLDLQPVRTNDQIESNFAPVLCGTHSTGPVQPSRGRRLGPDMAPGYPG